jgi:hypothetical protein
MDDKTVEHCTTVYVVLDRQQNSAHVRWGSI